MKWGALGFGLIVVVAIVWLVVNRPQRPEPAPQPETFEILFRADETLGQLTTEQLGAHIEAGRALFKRYQCIGCHADEGRSLRKFVALGNKYDVETLSAYLKRPNPPMPIFPLGDEERKDLSVYLIDRYPGEG